MKNFQFFLYLLIIVLIRGELYRFRGAAGQPNGISVSKHVDQNKHVESISTDTLMLDTIPEVEIEYTTTASPTENSAGAIAMDTVEEGEYVPTTQPTSQPTGQPTAEPSAVPTSQPSKNEIVVKGSVMPVQERTLAPSQVPVLKRTALPQASPTLLPSYSTQIFVITLPPSSLESVVPIESPTYQSSTVPVSTLNPVVRYEQPTMQINGQVTELPSVRKVQQSSAIPTTLNSNAKPQAQCLCNWATNCDSNYPCCNGLKCQDHGTWSQCVEPTLVLSKGNCISSENGYGCHTNGDCCNPDAVCKDKFCNLPCTLSNNHYNTAPVAVAVPIQVPTPSGKPLSGGCLCNWADGCSANTPCCPGLECQQYEYWSQCVESESILSKGNCISSNNGYGCQSSADCCNPDAECKDKFCNIRCADRI